MAENGGTSGTAGRGTETSSGSSSSLGIQFNRVGHDDTITTERIKPQMDAATKQRRAMIIAFVVLAFAAMLYISWERGGRENPFAKPANSGAFGPSADRNVDTSAAQDNK